MAAAWRTVRVFISSTFKDMQAERDHLVRFVFPRLREELLRRRMHFIDVDLRWGVTSEQDAQQVCREIVDECRPRFLCMLGGRYGWTPPGRDRSITADEVHYAALDQAEPDRHRFFYFRVSEATAAVVEDYPGQYREPPGSETERRLEELKQAIQGAGYEPFVYPAQWNAQQGRLVGLEEFGRRVYEELLASINEEFGTEAPEPVDEFAEEMARQEAFVSERTARYVVGSRQPVLDRVAEFASSDGEPSILALTGAPGSGKSALLGKVYQDLTAVHPDWLVVPHFVGASAGSTDLRRSLRRLCHDLQRMTGDDEPLPDGIEELISRLLTLLEQAGTTRRVVLVIDALNQMDPTDGAHTLRWLPRRLPQNVRIVVSSLAHPVLDTLRLRREQVVELELAPLTSADARAIAEGFAARYRKRLSEEQLEALLAKPESGSPLYLLVALEELRTLGTYEEITARIEQLPGGVRGLFLWILRERLSADPGFQDAQGHLVGTELVRRCVSHLGVSRHGLSHAELVGTVDPDDPRGNVAALERLLRPYLMRRGELLDFYHGQLHEAVEAVYLDEEHERLEAHHSLAVYFSQQGYGNLRTLAELPYHQTGAGMWDDLEGVLTDVRFVEGKTTAGMVFDLARDFATGAERLPSDRPKHRVLTLLHQALQRDIHFVARHTEDYPQALFQCLWNTCWWYDCPEAAAHYDEPDGGWPPGGPPWEQPGPKLWQLLRQWRTEKETATPGFLWLRSLRPPWMPLGTAELACLRGHEGMVESAAFSPDGLRIVSGSGDDTVRVWDAETGAELAVLRGHKSSVNSVAFSEDGTRIVSGSGDFLGQECSVRMWDAGSGVEVCCLRGHEGTIQSVAFSPDGSRIVSGSADKTVRVWDTWRCAEFLCIRGHESRVNDVAYSPDGTRIVSGSQDGTVRVWDADRGKQLLCLRAQQTWIETRAKCVAYSPDGSLIACGLFDGTTRLWDAKRGLELRCLHANNSEVKSVAFSPDASRIVSGNVDSEVRVWDVASGAELRCLRGHERDITSVSFSSDGSRIVSTSEDKTIRVWDGRRGADLCYLRVDEFTISSVAFSWDGTRIVTCCSDHTLRVWDTARGVQIHCWRVPEQATSAVFSPDGRWIVGALYQGTLQIWDAANGAELGRLRGHKGRIRTMAFHPDGSCIFCNNADDETEAWDPVSGECLEVLDEDYDLSYIAAGSIQSPWRFVARYPAAAIEPAEHDDDTESDEADDGIEPHDRGDAIASFPVNLDLIASHPQRYTWAGSRLLGGLAGGGYLHIITLEGDVPPPGRAT